MESVWIRAWLLWLLAAWPGWVMATGIAAETPSHLPPGEHAVRLQHAEWWRSSSQDWKPPPSLQEATDGVLSAHPQWRDVRLPHTRQRQTFSASPGDGTPPEVHWYRLQVPATALQDTPQGTRLYIPRWQTLGTLGVYANGKLVWQSRGSRVFVSFNAPVWVDLGGNAPKGESVTLHVRMATTAGVGSALSPVWAGPAEELRQGWRVRTLLQTELLTYVRGANLVLGLLALAAWVGRRKYGETGFLWFFLLSLSHGCATLFFLTDEEGFGAHDDWFSWLTVVGSLGASTSAFFLLSRLQDWRYPWLAKMLLAYAGMVALALLPLWSPPHGSMLPLVRLAQIPAALPLLWIALRGALRRRTWPHVLLAAVMLTLAPLWLHDVALQRFRLSPEHFYVTPYLYMGIITMFLIMALVRYQRTFEAAERANVVLGERLAAQEKELRSTHERLRAAERNQTLMQERQRLMREMHDGVGSSLMSALRLMTGPQSEPSGSVNVAQVLRECIDDLKISIDSLEPVDADLLALLAGLRFRMDQRLGEAGVVLHWHTSDLPALPWLDAQNALHVLRILQEVLTNIIKHSGATEITVTTAEAVSPLNDQARGVTVCIEDNGRPFTPPEHSEPGRRGLGNVRSRALALCAHCAWQPHAAGTRFLLWLPLTPTFGAQD